MLQKSTPTQAFILIKTPTCSGATLQLGTSSWSLESIQRAPDGTVNVPDRYPGVAYWIENLNNNTVFALSPTPENVAFLSSLQAGEEAILTWENCNSATYFLSAPQPIEQAINILANQSPTSMVVYVPGSQSTPGLLVQGDLTGETITSPPTYEPGSLRGQCGNFAPGNHHFPGWDYPPGGGIDLELWVWTDHPLGKAISR